MDNGTRKTGKTFVGVSIVIFISKIIGIARDIVFASIFGTTILTDLFQLIFSFPGYLFTSIGTALSSVNIPDLTYYINSRTREERNEYLSNLFAQITLWGTLLSLAGIVFAPASGRQYATLRDMFAGVHGDSGATVDSYIAENGNVVVRDGELDRSRVER